MLSNKEAVTIIIWYVVCNFVYSSVFQVPIVGNDTIVSVVVYSFTIILYSILGLFADVFIKRYGLIQFGLWIQWITALMSTIITAMSEYYQIQEWVQSLLYVILSVLEVLGLSTFQVVAIQFGTDQLQGAPSYHLSAFIFWYCTTEMIPRVLFQWTLYYSLSLTSLGLVKSTKIIHLGWNLFSAVFVSIVLSMKSCFMFNWFSIGERMPNDTWIRDSKKGNSNPYRLIYCILKYAQNHKYPVQRSALTYWEDEIPSRIDLGKSKYGGPFTSEEVENVKIFLQLIKVLLSLSGILVASHSAELSLFYVPQHFSHGLSDITQIVLIEALCGTIAIGLLILSYVVSPYLQRYLPSMLKRIGIGALLTTLCVLSILLIDSIGHATKNYEVPCFLFPSDITLDLSPYFLIIPNVLNKLSYMIFTISLFEFFIAQSPHSMKGLLIGLYYVIRYGLTGIIAIILYSAFKRYPVYSNTLSCGTANYIVIATAALLSLISYTIVAYKYKLRERDEVINFHAFAERYYES